MTLEEAIIHCKEKACDNTQCALEHRQLAEWLQELQQYRENARKEEMFQPFPSSDLDEAAEEYAWKEDLPLYDGERLSLCFKPRVNAFKAGAEWMARPCVKVEGRVSSQQGKRMMVTTNIFENDDWFVSDKVECFIRKKQ